MILRVEVKVDGKIMHVIEREVNKDAITAGPSVWDFIAKVKSTFDSFSAADFLYFR